MCWTWPLEPLAVDEDAAAVVRAAEWLGEHALPAYLFGLLCAMGLVALLFTGLRRLPYWLPDGSHPPLATLALRLLVGFGVVVAAGWLFAEMLDALDADEEIGLFDTHLAATLARALQPQTLRAIALLTHLGDPPVLVGLVALVALGLVWRRQWILALGWILACGGNGLLNPLLKEIFARARPLHTHGFAVAEGYSFPSGHTSGAVVVFGMLAYLAVQLLPARWHLPAVLAATAVAFSLGCSRVLLQVHWASDVVAGFGSGMGWLVACVLSCELLRHRYGPR